MILEYCAQAHILPSQNSTLASFSESNLQNRLYRIHIRFSTFFIDDAQLFLFPFLFILLGYFRKLELLIHIPLILFPKYVLFSLLLMDLKTFSILANFQV